MASEIVARSGRPLREHVNRYRLRVVDFPGRLFPVLDTAAVMEMRSVTQRYAEIHLELGSGSGGHLIEQARRCPGGVFIGFELRFKRSVRTIEKAQALGITNVFVIREDAHRSEDFAQDLSLAAVYVNFPDPWERSRDAKKRLLSPWLCSFAARKLRPRGMLSVKTDHRLSFEHFCEFCRNQPELEILSLSEDLHADAESSAGNVATEFERLFLREQAPICKLVAQRREI